MDVRAGYKLTAVGVVPEDWVVINIGGVASFTSGRGINIASLKEESTDAPVPVYGGNGVAGYTSAALTQEPTVVVGRVGQKCGEVYLTTGPAWITDNALYPRRFLRKPDVRFLALAMQSTGLNSLKNRNDLPLVTQSILHAVEVCLPPSEAEQRAIAAAFSDVDALLGGLDRLIAKKRDLRRAAMEQLLSGQTRLPGFCGEWNVKRLGELAEMGSGGTPLSSVPAYYDGEIPWVSISDMTSCGKVIDKTERKLSELGLANSAAQMFPMGTVLYAMYASLGVCSIAGVPLCTSQAILGLRPNRRLDSEFLYYYLASLKSAVKALGQQGTQANLNKGMVQGFRLALPSHSEQVAIVAVLSDMDAELSALEVRREKTRALKLGMMQELLTGRTRLT